MLPSTSDAIQSVLKTDPTIPPAQRKRMMGALRAGSEPQLKVVPPPDTAPRVIRRKEAARRLACCVRVVDRLAQEGTLKRVRLPGRVRAAGFLESDINQLLASNGE
jgi:hypothetical protein